MRIADVFIYVLAVLFGISAGMLELTVGDLLVTALAVLLSTLVLGFLRPRHAWKWIAIVGPFVPLMRIAAYLVLTQRPSRAQVWESGLAMVTGTAGAYAGAMFRMGVDVLFRHSEN